MRRAWETIRQFQMLESGDRVLIGVSGGPDSVALLHLLHSKAEAYGITLYVVHINHRLRPEAETEAAYVESLAVQYGLPFHAYTVDVAAYAKMHGMSLEQAGHVVRFQCFQAAKEQWQINKLALGHHRDDRAETALQHMVQGCGLDGLAAMPPVDVWDAHDHSYLIRPLSQVSKEEILAYCAAQNLHYYIDATNLQPDCLRNQIRLELLPLIKQYNPQIADALVRLQDSTAADLAYIETQVEQLWQQHGALTQHEVTYPADVFGVQHIAMQRRLLRYMYQQWTGSTADLSFAQVEQMRNIALQKEGTQQVSLSDKTVFMRQYHLLKITTKPMTAEEPIVCTWQFASEPEIQIWNGVFSVQTHTDVEPSRDNEAVFVFVDAEKLDAKLTIRNRHTGDKIVLPGTWHHKTVKKLFIDQKVPKEERNSIPLVISGEEIVWIPGIYLSESIRTTGETKQICKLCFSRR